MATFILLTKLSAASLGKPKNRKEVGRAWLKEVKKKCPEVRWVDHYALLGPFDFMDIYEAPDEKVAARVSMITMEKGAVKAETWAALQYKDFLHVIQSL
jgi:uncharacterized protein with GYD domain